MKRLFTVVAVALAAAGAATLFAQTADSGGSGGPRGQHVKVAPQGGDSSAERRVALVIGNAAYKDAPLRNPVNDARAVAKSLGGLGFDVTLKENAGLKDMFDSVRSFGDAIAAGKGVALFYFAGHGMQVAGTNYLVPVDADIEREDEVKFQALDASLVLAKMDSARGSVNIVILDACRNNPFARSFRTQSRGLTTMDAPEGTLIAYATAPGSVAADGEGENGLFTSYLLESMRLPGLKVEDVFKRIRVGVRNATSGKQVPWEASSLIGDFYFMPGREPQQTVAMPTVSPTRTPTPTPTFAPTPPPTATAIASAGGQNPSDMVLIPGGAFRMGSKKSYFQDEDEKPAHTVTLSGFFMDKFEVTVDQFRRFCSETGRTFPGQPAWNAGNDPVVNVDWNDATTYCAWADRRLPTEAEWEYAARGGLKGASYPWGNDVDRSKGNFGTLETTTTPVGSFKANGFGLYDMAGNVSEWCSDWYDEKYYSATDGARDPKGPLSGTVRVVRGGSRKDPASYMRVSIRFRSSVDNRGSGTGFRCARTQ